MGRGAVGFLEAFVVAAFAPYIFIAVCGPVTET
ncbi:hypothetical protein HNQ72_004471 [Rhizobium wenxiniae]|uniref:Uncharacterized protein n=1 Tax=Rhizobium wenxiniae TaxID=1737357 RepID=A0A7W9Y9T4_9HYPH|nr:hypothetical protein [Rhizobium wenxiniae]